MGDWFWAQAGNALFVLASTVAIYLTAVVSIRVIDRRALSEMTAFDFVVAVALGSIVARTATTEHPTYTEGAVAIVTLLAGHTLVSLARRHWSGFRRVVERAPVTLVRDGAIDRQGLAEAHLVEDDVWAELRQHGITRIDEVASMVLEASGDVSVIRDGAGPQGRWSGREDARERSRG